MCKTLKKNWIIPILYHLVNKQLIVVLWNTITSYPEDLLIL